MTTENQNQTAIAGQNSDAAQPSITEIRQSFTRKPYTVGEFFGKDEEGACEQCGCPLNVGDKAQEIWWEYDQTEPVGFVCSSSKCAGDEIEKRAQSELEMRSL